MMDLKLSMITYNSRGTASNNIEMIKYIESKCNHDTIINRQEHFLLDKNCYKLSKYFYKHKKISKGAHKSYDIMNVGKPQGSINI